MSIMTLLEIVQNTLSSMDSDPVNSISDTPDSRQIIEVAKETYFEVMMRDHWPHLGELIQLESVSDVTRPNYLRIPDNIFRVDEFRYDKQKFDAFKPNYTEVIYCPPSEFLKMIYSRNPSASNIIEVKNFNKVSLYIYTDKPPQYWTSFDDEYIVCDSYDVLADSTLQMEKTSAIGFRIPSFESKDKFKPDIPEQFFPYYLAEVKRACHIYFKQQPSPIDEQRAQRGLARLKQEAWRQNGGIKKNRYGWR